MVSAHDAASLLHRTVDPHSTAIVVIDVQNDFCAKGGYFDRSGADLSLVERAMQRLPAFLDAARAAGVMVIFVRNHYDPVYMSAAQNDRRRRLGWDTTLCHAGTWGADFYKVAPLPDEPVVTKHRYDAFYCTDLEVLLRVNGIKSVIFTGVATNTCVETTLRNAYVRDFEVVLAEDCCAARASHFHRNTIETVQLLFGLVARADEIEAAWQGRSRKLPDSPAHAAE